MQIDNPFSTQAFLDDQMSELYFNYLNNKKMVAEIQESGLNSIIEKLINDIEEYSVWNNN